VRAQRRAQPAFVAAQLLGALLAVGLLEVLYPAAGTPRPMWSRWPGGTTPKDRAEFPAVNPVGLVAGPGGSILSESWKCPDSRVPGDGLARGTGHDTAAGRRVGGYAEVERAWSVREPHPWQ
jgi:hypothetical protein